MGGSLYTIIKISPVVSNTALRWRNETSMDSYLHENNDFSTRLEQLNMAYIQQRTEFSINNP